LLKGIPSDNAGLPEKWKMLKCFHLLACYGCSVNVFIYLIFACLDLEHPMVPPCWFAFASEG